jgi:hypothetical protein
MRQIVDTIESLGTLETPRGTCQLCATACAEYDESDSRLVVRLDAFLRTTDLQTAETKFSADWVPKAETLRESVDFDEAPELAHEIFQHWVRKVRHSAPPELNTLAF